MRRLLVTLSLLAVGAVPPAALAEPIPPLPLVQEFVDVCVSIDPPSVRVGACTYTVMAKIQILGTTITVACDVDLPEDPLDTGPVGETLRCLVKLEDCESRLPNYVSQQCVFEFVGVCEDAGGSIEGCLELLLSRCTQPSGIPDPCLTTFTGSGLPLP